MLNKDILFPVGAAMMVLGVGGVVFGGLASANAVTIVKIATVVYSIGAVLFAAIQMSQTYEGNNIVIRRLRRIMVMGDICFIIAALLMIENNFMILFPYMARTIDGYNNWIHYVYNNWVVALLIAAILEMYTTHRISYETKKDMPQ